MCSTDTSNGNLSDSDYERFRDMILARTGMLFDARRRAALARGILDARERDDSADTDEYYRRLQQARTDGELWDDLVCAITVGETYFFRNKSHMDALRRHILPDLIARHREARRLRIWSAGCASGEEPYSVAVLLHQLLPGIADWNVLILATDIDRQALRRARAARYGEWSFRQADPLLREAYFTQRSDGWELRPQIRETVTFAYLNLVEDAYPSLATNTNAMDLILCRNVAIYLPEAVVRQNAARFYRCLAPDGWFIAGASEANAEIYARFATTNLDNAIVYRKAASSSPLPASDWRAIGPEPGPAPRVAPEAPPAAVPAMPAAAPAAQIAEQSRDVAAEPTPAAPQTAAAQSGRENPRNLYHEALALMAQGAYREAVVRLHDCALRDPDSASACYHQMARAHANEGRLEEARSWALKASEGDPLFAEAHYVLSLIHQELGAVDEAVAALRKALCLAPDLILAHVGLADLYRRLGSAERAARHRAHAVRLAARMAPDEVVPHSEGLTAGQLLKTAKAM